MRTSDGQEACSADLHGGEILQLTTIGAMNDNELVKGIFGVTQDDARHPSQDDRPTLRIF